MTNNAHTLLSEIERDVLNDDVSLGSILRKCIVLAGRTDAAELRSWATKELRGYVEGDDVPEYRAVGAPIHIDATVGPNRVTGQRISPHSLPEPARGNITDKYTFYVGVGEIEATIAEASGSHVRLSLPGAPELAALLNHQAQQPFQNIESVYWSIAVASLRGILDHVRTTLAEMVAELRVTTPDSTEPAAREIDKALSMAVEGSGHIINVLTAQARDSGHATIGAPGGDAAADSPFWTQGRKIGAFTVGAATVGAGIATIIATFK